MTTSTFYVDPSVISGLVPGDMDVDQILGEIEAGAALVFDRFGFGEVVSAIGARSRAMRETDADAWGQVAALREMLIGWHEYPFVAADLDRGIEPTSRASLALKFPDAIHIATAERLGLPLLTGDRQQGRAARHVGLAATMLTMRKT